MDQYNSKIGDVITVHVPLFHMNSIPAIDPIPYPCVRSSLLIELRLSVGEGAASLTGWDYIQLYSPLVQQHNYNNKGNKSNIIRNNE